MSIVLVLDASVSVAWPHTPRHVVELADRYHLQGYDALYFDLAHQLKLPLATLDDGRRQAAKSHGVTLFTAST